MSLRHHNGLPGTKPPTTKTPRTCRGRMTIEEGRSSLKRRAAGQTRTDDLRFTKASLYQLSYGGVGGPPRTERSAGRPGKREDDSKNRAYDKAQTAAIGSSGKTPLNPADRDAPQLPDPLGHRIGSNRTGHLFGKGPSENSCE